MDQANDLPSLFANDVNVYIPGEFAGDVNPEEGDVSYSINGLVVEM